jgi:hypothetical protein
VASNVGVSRINFCNNIEDVDYTVLCSPLSSTGGRSHLCRHQGPLPLRWIKGDWLPGCGKAESADCTQFSKSRFRARRSSDQEGAARWVAEMGESTMSNGTIVRGES